MDDKEPTQRKEEEKPISEEIIKVNHERKQRQDDAGPSGAVLPGAIQPLPKAGLSRSEHSINQIITTQDVTNALKSLSFGAPKQCVTNLNFKDLKIPFLDKNLAEDPTDSTLIDLKQLMASWFQMNKDHPALAIDKPLQGVHAAILSHDTPALLNSSCNTDCNPPPELANEVLVTIEPKLSKGEKKKNSGNISDRSDNTQRDSLSSIGSNVCRICMTRGRERLISPCNCKGSLQNVHLSCLERWLNQVGRNHCELCGFSYPAIRTPRYTLVQALRLWFGNPRNRSHLQSDCLIFWLLSTVTAGLLAVCIVGTQYFVIEGKKFGKMNAATRRDEGISHRITETAMDFFMAIVLCGYSVTVYLLWKDHYLMWNRWRRANVNVRLLLTPDTDPVPFEPRTGYVV